MKIKNLNRTQSALLLIITNIALSIIFGIIFGAFSHICLNESESLLNSIFIATKTCFLFFFAGGVISGIILLITKIEENFAYYLGFVLYYGTAISSYLIKTFCNSTEGAWLIGFIITVMASYIAWLIIKNNELKNTIKEMQFDIQFKSKQ